MNEEIKRALEVDRLIDITTTGRQSGQEHRIEIGFHRFDGQIYISGLPGIRDWYANLIDNPEFTFHLKQSTDADIPAQATPIEEGPERDQVIRHLVRKWDREDQLQDFLDRSPLLRVDLDLEAIGG